MKHVLVLTTLALALSAPALASDKKQSISLFGNITIPENGGTQGNIFLSFGQLVGSSFEFEGSIAQNYTSQRNANGSSSDITFTTLGLGAKYYFRPVGAGGSALPYLKLGASGSRSNQANSSDYSSYLGGAGIEFAMNESASTFVEAVYQQNKYDSSFIKDDTSVVVNIGIKLRF